MKPRRRLSPRLWSRPTGTANRPPAFSRSATKPCSTRSASMESRNRKGTTSSRRELSLRSQASQSSDGAPNLGNRQRDGLTFCVIPRSRANRDGVVSRRGPAHRSLRAAFAARRQQQDQSEQRSHNQHSRNSSPSASSADTDQQGQSRHDQPDRIELSSQENQGGSNDWSRHGGDVQGGRAGALQRDRVAREVAL